MTTSSISVSFSGLSFHGPEFGTTCATDVCEFVQSCYDSGWTLLSVTDETGEEIAGIEPDDHNRPIPWFIGPHRFVLRKYHNNTSDVVVPVDELQAIETLLRQLSDTLWLSVASLAPHLAGELLQALQPVLAGSSISPGVKAGLGVFGDYLNQTPQNTSEREF